MEHRVAGAESQAPGAETKTQLVIVATPDGRWCHNIGISPPTLLWKAVATCPTGAASVELPLEYVPQGVQTACDPAIAKIEMHLGLDLGTDEDPIWDWGHTGLHIFPGARLLGGYLLSAEGRALLAGRRVLELGCGVGVLGPVALLAGARHVVLTDVDPVALDLCRHNQQRTASIVATLVGADIGTSVVKRCDWRSEIEEARAEHADIILATDVVYDAGLSSALREFLVALTNERPGTTVLLALQHRGESATSETLVEEWLGTMVQPPTEPDSAGRTRSRSPRPAPTECAAWLAEEVSRATLFHSKRLATLAPERRDAADDAFLLKGLGGEGPETVAGFPPLRSAAELWRLDRL